MAQQIVGFVRGVLSNKKCKHTSYKNAIDYIVKFLGYKNLSEIKKPDHETIERRKYISSMKKLSLSPKQQTTGWTRKKDKGDARNTRRILYKQGLLAYSA